MISLGQIWEPVQALFHIDVGLSKEYALYIHELEQTVVVFIFVHLLQILYDSETEFFNDAFVKALVFTLLGFSFYFLVWKKMFKFIYEDTEEVEGFKGTYRIF